MNLRAHEAAMYNAMPAINNIRAQAPIFYGTGGEMANEDIEAMQKAVSQVKAKVTLVQDMLHIKVIGEQLKVKENKQLFKIYKKTKTIEL